MTEKERIKQREYRKKNADKVRANRLRWMEENKEALKAKKKAWRDANPDKVREMNKRNHAKRKDKANEYQNTKYKNNPIFRLRKNLANTINKVLARNGYSKTANTQEIIGCSFEEFKQHLEAQFEPWMNWDNKGLYNGTPEYGWDIDHIIPLKTAESEDDIIRLNHYTNLRPLCSYINRVVKKATLIL